MWTIPFAVAIAVGMFVILRAARELHRRIDSREFALLPLAGLAVAGLAIAFDGITDHSVNDVLFSGEVALPGLVADAETWSAGALALVIAFKGLAWTISLASFRGGPVFPALFLGAAAGLLASHLPGFDQTAAVTVGMGAATVSALGLPLSAVVLATVLSANSGAGATPLDNRRSGRRLPHDSRVIATGPKALPGRGCACLSHTPRRLSTGGSTAS